MIQLRQDRFRKFASARPVGGGWTFAVRQSQERLEAVGFTVEMERRESRRYPGNVRKAVKVVEYFYAVSRGNEIILPAATEGEVLAFVSGVFAPSGIATPSREVKTP